MITTPLPSITHVHSHTPACLLDVCLCRFDIMGHHSMSTMGKIRAALDSLTLEQHGVDGKTMYLYGEAWDFGEVACNQRFRNASQLNLAGSKIGGFNDRCALVCVHECLVSLLAAMTGVLLHASTSANVGMLAHLPYCIPWMEWLNVWRMQLS